jgi:hypothetical protein
VPVAVEEIPAPTLDDTENVEDQEQLLPKEEIAGVKE